MGKIGGADLKACRLIDVELQRAVGEAKVNLCISDPHYCSHSGKCREVWGTRALADDHHKAKHPDLPNGSVPITMQEGCRYIAVALEVGQAAWTKGVEDGPQLIFEPSRAVKTVSSKAVPDNEQSKRPKLAGQSKSFSSNRSRANTKES